MVPTQSEDKLGAVALCKEGAHVLCEDVADGEAAQDQALLLRVPLEAAVAGVTTVALKNEGDSFQPFVGVFDTCPVWHLLVLLSDTHVANMTPLRAIDGNISYHSNESFTLFTSVLQGRFG